MDYKLAIILLALASMAIVVAATSPKECDASTTLEDCMTCCKANHYARGLITDRFGCICNTYLLERPKSADEEQIPYSERRTYRPLNPEDD